MNKNAAKRGFQLIELMVVIAVIGILATFILINSAGAKAKANDAKVLNDMTAATKTAVRCLGDGYSFALQDSTDYNNEPVGGPNKSICASGGPEGYWPYYSARLRSADGGWWEANGLRVNTHSDPQNIYLNYGSTGGTFVSCTGTSCRTNPL